MASKHRDIGLKFRYRSTPNTRRVTKNVGFGGGGGTIYMLYTYILSFPFAAYHLHIALYIQNCSFPLT